MAESCPRCGLHFHRIPGHWLGSWFINIVVVQASVVAVLVVGVATTYPNTPVGAIFAIGLVVAVVVPFAFFPFSRTIWTAIDLAMRPLTFDEGVAPGFELDAEVKAEEARLEGSGPGDESSGQAGDPPGGSSPRSHGPRWPRHKR